MKHTMVLSILLIHTCNHSLLTVHTMYQLISLTYIHTYVQGGRAYSKRVVRVGVLGVQSIFQDAGRPNLPVRPG